MDLTKTLQGIGFRDVEAKVYLATLELGEALASEIAKKARLKRPSVYVILKDLMKKGHISSYSRRGVTRFMARDPKLIVSAATERADSAHHSLPELLALYKHGDKPGKPRIQYFEDTEGLITIMEDTIVTADKTILSWADLALAYNTLRDYYPTYTRKRIERNIFVKGIYEDNKIGLMFQQNAIKARREVRLIPEKTYNLTNEIMIYDDKVAILSHKDLIGVIIQSQDVADSQRAIFHLGWEMAEHLTKNKK